MPFTLTSPAFQAGAVLPRSLTCDGQDRSPMLVWRGAPAGTRSLTLILHDPDAPSGDFTHWVLFDIPARVKQLPEGVAPTAVGVPGTNDFGKIGYGGPCPPPGRPHRYIFTLYALSQDHVGLRRGARRDQVEARMRGHILAQAQLPGLYGRK